MQDFVQEIKIPLGSQQLAGVLHLPSGNPCSMVICSHGLLSSKDSVKYLLLAQVLNEAGVGLLRFDFCGCGESSGSMKETTVAGRIEDLAAAVKAVRLHPSFSGKIGLLGSSMGGYVSLFYAQKDPEIAATVCWATPSNMKDMLARKTRLKLYGLGEPFFKELKAQTYMEAPGGVSKTFIIHGDKDEVVPPPQAQEIYQRSTEPKELYYLTGSDHRISDPAHRLKAVQKSKDWFLKFL